MKQQPETNRHRYTAYILLHFCTEWVLESFHGITLSSVVLMYSFYSVTTKDMF